MIEIARATADAAPADVAVPVVGGVVGAVGAAGVGLSLPQPLIRAFNWPQIKSRVTIDGVVTVVDAVALSEGRFAADERAVAHGV